MDKNTRSKIVSIILSLGILLGGIAICVLIEVVASGPLMNDDSTKALVMVFTAVSFLLSGFIGLLTTILGDTWMKKIQLSLEALFLVAATSAFLALKEGIHIPVNGDCSQHVNVTKCSCTYVSADINCKEMYNYRDTAYSLVFLYVVVWIFCVIDIVRGIAAACSSEKQEESEIPGLHGNDLRFYNISYPSLEDKQRYDRKFSFFKKKNQTQNTGN